MTSRPNTLQRPVPRRNAAAWRAWEVPVYVHAPYLLNPSSIKPELRAKSRAALMAQVNAAAQVGARGVVVHGGHPTGDGTTADAVAGWVEVLSGWVPAVPVLIENTAGGAAGPARTLDGLRQLWAALGDLDTNVGFCLDTCHAHAGGLALDGLVDRLLPIVGRIDLVHPNDSRDSFNSGRDRHANLGAGEIGLDAIVDVVAAANAPTVVETPGGPEAMAADIAALRGRLADR